MKALGLVVVFLATIPSTYGHALNTSDDVKGSTDKPNAPSDPAAMDDPCFSANDKHRLQCMKKVVLEMVKGARASFESGDYPSALGQLEEAKQYDPGNPLLYFDEALAFSRMGERQKAINQLDLCIWLAREGHKKEDAEIFRARLLTQDPLTYTKGGLSAKTMEEVNHGLESFQSLPRWRMPPGVETQQLCQVIENERIAPTSPVIFDKAFCAEIRGDMVAAAERFSGYLIIAPEAQDATRVREHIKLLSELSGLPGDAGKRVRGLYGDVALYSSINHFELVRERLKSADDVLPNFLATKREIAKLAVRRADFSEAREYYDLLRLHPEFRDEAEERIDWINWNEPDYRDAVQAAANVIATLVQSRLDTHDPESTTFRRGLEQVGQYLGAAVAISDLGTDAHSLLATASLMASNYNLVADSTDIVFAHGAPLIFFNREGRRVEIWPDKIVVRDVSALSPEVRLRPTLPEDRLCAIPPEDQSCPILSTDQVAPTKIPISSISAIAVKESNIQISLTGDELTFTPAFTGPVQQMGPLARKHANNYVKLIARYAPVSQVKYGPERLNKKEMGELGIEMLAIAASFYLMTQGKVSGQPVSKWGRISHLTDGMKYFLMAKESARFIVFFVEVLKERQRASELPTLRFLPSREPRLEFREAW